MTYEDFLALDEAHIDNLSPALAALALDRLGRWEAAHARAQKEESLDINRVHAYLHRKEGTMSNAKYWYDRVGEPVPSHSFDEEWTALVRRFLK